MSSDKPEMMSAKQPESSDRSTSIDVLRGLAALSVAFFHARDVSWIGISQLWHLNRFTLSPIVLLGYATAPFKFGFLGVPLFFVLSGYCIHRPNAKRLAQDPAAPFDFKRYIKRRLWRIYPVLAGALLLTALGDYFLRANSAFPGGDDSLKAFIANFFSFQNIFAPPYGTNASLWTLGIELHFYLLYPLLLFFLRRIGPVKITLAVFGISLFYVLLDRVFKFGIVTFVPYWFTWVVGLLIAEGQYRKMATGFRGLRVLVWTAVSGAVGCVLILAKMPDFAEFMFAVSFGSLLVWSLSEGGNRFWNRQYFALLASIGVFSYSLYAIHRPLFYVFRKIVFDGNLSPSIITPIVFVAVSVICAWCFYQLIERHSLRLPEKSRLRSQVAGVQ